MSNSDQNKINIFKQKEFFFLNVWLIQMISQNWIDY